MNQEAVREPAVRGTARSGRSRLRIVSLVVAVCSFVVGGALYVYYQKPRVTVPPPQRAERFDGDQAFAYLEAICQLGARISDTPAMRRQQEILQKHFETLGATVEYQRFDAAQPSLRGRTFECVNLIVRWHPESQRRVLLGCHYDTRPIADREPISRNRQVGQFLGANDGASGVALLMELGKLIPEMDLNVGVDFVFFDAEEYIFDSRRDKYFIGSEGFVQRYLQEKPDYRYEKVAVVDMVADKDLQIHPDQRSAVRAGPLVHEVWQIAAELGVEQFYEDVRYDILDDHVPFQDAGIPAIVLIDFEYPHWHLLSDTPDKCSGESLKAVGRVVAEWLRRQR